MKNNNRLRILSFCVLAAAMLGIILFAVSRSKDTPPQQTTTAPTAAGDTTAPGSNAPTSTTTTTTKAAPTSAPSTAASTKQGTTGSSGYGREYAYAGYTPAFANVDADPWYLMLVNPDYILPEGYTVKLAHAITGDTNSKQLDHRVAPHYNEMYLAAKKDGITLSTVSGYRSLTTQKRLFEEEIGRRLNDGYSRVQATQMAAKWVMLPGSSEHNAGLAMDIISLQSSFDQTKAFRWLQENAADYGFILRYAKDKVSITKVNYEPWHWRYVGVEHAKAIQASGECLEEYLGKAG